MSLDETMARASGWPGPAAPERRLGDVLDGVVDFVRSFVVLEGAQADAIALWVAHTWAFEAASATPYLAVQSAEKRSGKTLLLDVLELLVARPWRAISPTEAVLFRQIEAVTPTLLLDEYDTIFHTRREAATEPVRAILNAGFREGTTVPRCVGDGSKMMKVVDFKVFCPKALSGIGTLPDTVRDRAIVISMKRKAPGENVERFRRRRVEGRAAAVRAAVEATLAGLVDELRAATPVLPEELDDRAADSWEPLLAIAEAAGAAWAERARTASVALSTGSEREDASVGVRLLADIQAVFARDGGDRIATARLLDELAQDDEAPWADWHGKPLTARALGSLLRRYSITSRTVRFDDDTTAKGFHREQFDDAWRRYLSHPSQEQAYPSHPSHQQPSPADVPSQHQHVTETDQAANPHQQTLVTHVTVGGGGEEEDREDPLLEPPPAPSPNPSHPSHADEDLDF